ncbi:uncharacterized protein HD556DRAFT_1526827 [Suillus plorans]|uniref:RING-type domain-containing protein n=1 Tax=Suillus plorans TaxID=116603 RepID=A0A9P7ATF2_9AGAM|nr:uncharacterized protein HD556DRAFT_1526827 [Suillus plorans]KAG1795087.1 hypothetical protein HD556DRAFT_1526827 [Suillus plorans]
MPDELLVECSIHLDGVPLKDIRSFKCGHGFCNTCIENLFQAGPPPFKCPTCRKRIQRKDAFQIFLNPHQSLTQPSTQSPRRDSGVDIDFTLSDDPDSTIEHVSSLRKKTRENAAELQRLNKRLEQLRRNLLSANKERDELDDQHQELQREHDLLQAQHADLKSTCTTHENERRKVERSIAVLQKKCAVAESTEQTWRENCKTAQRDARNARKEKEELDEGLKELAERAREFEHRAHRNKVAYDKYKGKYEALKEENARLQKIQQTVEIPEEQSLLVVDRNAPDRLERAVDEDWLDDVCEVRGDNLDDIDSDYGNESSKENEDEGPSRGATWLRGKRATESVDDRERSLPEDRPYRPYGVRLHSPINYTSDWNLKRDSTGQKAAKTNKRKNEGDAIMGARPSKVVKITLQPTRPTKGKGRATEGRGDARLLPSPMQMPGSPLRKAPASKSKTDFPIKLDPMGRLMGTAVLGSRRKFDKNS